MKRLMAGFCLVGLWTASVLPASAGWDNVFQPTLFGRSRQATVTQYYSPPAVVYSSPAPVVVANSSPCDTCAPPPQQQCTTNYVQRCYYQPVTVYQNKTVMEQVTTYRTSYYYEPVTSVRYSAYYDPSSCCYQQVAIPTTSYQLRAQNCPVQSWVSRCVQEPVTVQQKVCFWQPQTTCCSTTTGALIPMSGPTQTAPPAGVIPNITPPSNPLPNIPPVTDAPKVDATKVYSPPAPPGTKPNMWDSIYPPTDQKPEIRSNITPGTSWQPQLNAPVPMPQTPAPTPPGPPVKFDRISVGPNSHVEGQVVRSDNSPKGNAKLLFINAGTGQRQTIFANTAGRFQTELPSGSWHVYVHGADDVPVHHTRIDVNGAQNRQVNLVNRSN